MDKVLPDKFIKEKITAVNKYYEHLVKDMIAVRPFMFF